MFTVLACAGSTLIDEIHLTGNHIRMTLDKQTVWTLNLIAGEKILVISLANQKIATFKMQFNF